MPRDLKQSASGTVKIGPFLDATNGVTPETALTITQPDIRLSKNDGAFAQKNAAQTLSHDENGYYDLTLDATDRNTLGSLKLAITKSGALPHFEDFEVITSQKWDALHGTDRPQVDVREKGDSTLGLTTHEKTDVNIEADTAASDYGALKPTVASRTLDVTVTGEAGIDLDNTVGTLAKNTNITGFNDLSAAQVNTECDSALTDYDPPTKTEMDGVHTTTDALITTLDAVADAIKAVTDNLPNSGALSDLATILTDTATTIPGLIAALNNLSAAQVKSQVVSAINGDTYAEPGQGIPASTLSHVGKMNYLYKWARNKLTQTSTTRNHYNDAGSVVDQKATVSDDATTYIKGEIVSGP